MVTSVSGSSSLSQLFSKIDSKRQGYIEKSDLASIFQSISGSGDDSSVEDLFSMLDSDSDGKVTEREFSTTLSKLQQQLEDQFGQMRMQQGMQGMPPPPPQNDEGFTQDELSAQLEEIGDSDSERASLISDIVSNFAAADSDGDGKVSFAEAMAYKQSTEQTDSSTTAETAMAMGAGMQGMPPPPPPQDDEGFTLDQLQAQLEEIGDTDSQRASLISNIVSNFEAADTDGDGKVSFAEAMAYDKSQQGGGSDSATTSASTTVSGESGQYDAVSRILQLLQAYSRPDDSNISSLLDTLA